MGGRLVTCEHDNGPLSGLYSIHCPACRVRMVKSARPSRAMQERMLGYIKLKCGQGAVDEVISSLKAEGGAP